MRAWKQSSLSDKIFDVFNVVYILLAGFVVAYPLYFIVIASISEPNAVNAGSVALWPVGISFDSYKAVFRDANFWVGFRNSVLYTVSGTVVNVSLTLMAAYALSRKDLVGRGVIMGFLVFTMYFSGGLIPTYLIVQRVGLYNNPLVVIILGAVGVYNVIIARSFFQSNLPDELLEAAFIDGCGNAGFFVRIALPLSGAIVAVLTLFYGVGHWNSYFNAMIYLSKYEYYPLQIILRDILVLGQASQAMMNTDYESYQQQLRFAEQIKYGVIIISSLPVLAIYPFIQRHFVKGVMIGSVKG